MIPVLWVPQRSRGSWDQGIVEELTSGPEFDHVPPVKAPQEMPGAVVVLAGQHVVESAAVLARQIADLPWALTIVTSDEEALFPVELLPHDEQHVTWGQYHARPEFERVIPIGAAPGTPSTIKNNNRDLAVSFIGQDTHERRHELLAVIKDMACDVGRYGNIAWLATTGFRQGVDQDEYLATLARTRIAPCPSGPHSLDSFRPYEALAAGALPIIEVRTPHGPEPGFWVQMFGPDCPIPCVANWTHQLPVLVDKFADPDVWDARRDEVARWFQGYREDLAIDFERTIARLRKG